jgi:hypothetical protein
MYSALDNSTIKSDYVERRLRSTTAATIQNGNTCPMGGALVFRSAL